MTEEHKRRIIQAINETDSLINMEMNISEDLRHHDQLAFYQSHKAKLQTMLEEV